MTQRPVSMIPVPISLSPFSGTQVHTKEVLEIAFHLPLKRAHIEQLKLQYQQSISTEK